MRAKDFREDLYYRLNVVRVKLPPLRERVEDIPQIVDFFLQSLAKTKKTKVRRISPEALAVLCRHGWPGNVRELENVVYRSAVIAQGDAILPKDLPEDVRQSPASVGPQSLEPLLDALFVQLQSANSEDMIKTVTAALRARMAAAGTSIAAKSKKSGGNNR